MGGIRDILDKHKFPDDAKVQKQLGEQVSRVRTRLASVRRKLLVLSGKGGVGKSTVTSQLALALARRGQRVGVLDADINGSSIPGMLGLRDRQLGLRKDGAVPPRGPHGIAVASMPFLAHSNGPLRWNGPMDLTPTWLGMMEAGVLREFLADVAWGELDSLLVDLPPGAAADKPPIFINLIPDLDGAIVVTTPSAVAVEVVRKSILYARDLGIPVLGIVENMAAIQCPHCEKSVPLHPPENDAVTQLARDMDLSVLARIPNDADLGRSLENGVPLAPDHTISKLFLTLAERLTAVPEAV